MLCRWIIAVCCIPLIAGELAGPTACNACHPAQYASQIGTHHASALRAANQTSLLSMLSSQPLRERSGISFEYEEAPGGVRVKAKQGAKSASALIEWAFGSGAQAITPVGVLDGRYFEHRISYYTAPQAPRRTLGHPGTPSKDPVTALGVPQQPETIFRCFNCHATGVKPGPSLDAMIPGVTCERCHGPGVDHLAGRASMSAKRTRSEVMQLCSSCHRMPEHSSASPEADDPLSIRFAPVGLMASACFRKSAGLSCITCHDPHQDASHDVAHYTAKCLGCHEQSHQGSLRQREDCVRCHMQQRSPAAYLTFTDHRIRVYPNPQDRLGGPASSR